MKKKLAALALGLALLAVPVAAMAAASSGPREMELPHYDQLTEGKDYNRNLFYRNDLTCLAADPSVIYITEGEQKGYFYMYATSDDIGVSGYQCWRSKDLVNWECMGVAFLPDRNGWAIQNFWAPECVYYKKPGEEKGKYYLFYNAWNDTRNDKRHSIGLAVADEPQGPFVQYTGTNTDGREITLMDTFIDADRFPEGTAIKGAPLIDASPFVDSDGKIYLFMVLDIQFGAANSSIWGMPMKDMFTPDYDNVKQLTRFGWTQVSGGEPIAETNRTNEGPFMYRKGDTYYLTFSTSNWESPNYSVAQAISTDGPLGDFTKVALEKGGNLLTYLGVNGEYNYDHMSGTGHHSFVPVGDELFMMYHAYVDRYGATKALGRAIAADRVTFVNNGDQEILYANGPSYSLQPLPSESTGFKNIISEAEVTATNTVEGYGVQYLTDGLYKNHNYDFIKEFKANGGTQITIKFAKKMKVRAIMVYNAFDYAESFDKIDKIAISTQTVVNGKKFKGNAIITDLGYDPLYRFEDKNDPEDKAMRPGGSAIAEFNLIETDTITISISKTGTLALSDIVILGTEA